MSDFSGHVTIRSRAASKKVINAYKLHKLSPPLYINSHLQAGVKCCDFRDSSKLFSLAPSLFAKLIFFRITFTIRSAISSNSHAESK